MNNLFLMFTCGANPFASAENMALKQACDSIENRQKTFKEDSVKRSSTYAIQTDRSDRQIAARVASRYTDGFVTTAA